MWLSSLFWGCFGAVAGWLQGWLQGCRVLKCLFLYGENPKGCRVAGFIKSLSCVRLRLCACARLRLCGCVRAYILSCL